MVENDIREEYDIPEENQNIQTEFIGNIMWSLFDLITFGAFEKKPKQKKQEIKNEGNSTNAQPQVVVQKVIEYRDKPVQAAPAASAPAPAQAQAQPDTQTKKEDTKPESTDSEDATTKNEVKFRESDGTINDTSAESEAQTESKGTLGQLSRTSTVKQQVKGKLSSYSDDDIAEVLNSYTPRKEAILDQISNFGSYASSLSQTPKPTALVARKLDKEDLLLKSKLKQIKSEHSKELDFNQIDEVFHSFSHLNENSEQREITQEGAENAQQELFRKWDIYLSDSEQTRLDKDYLVPSFKLALNIGRTTIGVDQAEEVVRGMFPSSTQEGEKLHISPQFTNVDTQEN